MEYKIVYSTRKTVGFTVKDGALTVRAPKGFPREKIDQLINRHSSWINTHIERSRKKLELYTADEKEIARLKKAAKEYFDNRIEYFSNIMGLKYGRMSITSAKTRFGSCNSRGDICFSYRLMLYPEAAREYVVVHELAHLRHMNHSAAFYALVEKYMPDYKERRRLLKL